MATFRKRGDKWQVEVFKMGVRRSATFTTKAKAQFWATEIEESIQSQKIAATASNTTLFNVLEKYKDIKVSQKRNPQRYTQVVDFFQKNLPFVNMQISKITTEMVAAYRDERLKTLKKSSMKTELLILSGVFTYARRELKVIHINPVSDVTKPVVEGHRERRIPPNEEEAILKILGFNQDECANVKQETAHFFVLALETAMRIGELTTLTRGRIFEKYVLLDKTKNGSSRVVPLSKRARASITAIINSIPTNQECLTTRNVKAVTKTYSYAISKNLEDYPELKGVTFHDTRHEAIYRLAKKFEVLELAKITGHHNINQLLTYYNPTPDELAAKLD